MKFFKIFWFISSFFLFGIPLTYAEESTRSKYKNWEVSKLDDLIMYRTNGNIVHGHSLGWIKRKGQCNYDNLYLTYSSSHEDKDILEKLKNNKIAVCYLNGDFTVKRVKIEKDHIYLIPENKNYDPIKVTEENEFIVWGVVTYVVKKV